MRAAGSRASRRAGSAARGAAGRGRRWPRCRPASRRTGRGRAAGPAPGTPAGTRPARRRRRRPAAGTAGPRGRGPSAGAARPAAGTRPGRRRGPAGPGRRRGCPCFALLLGSRRRRGEFRAAQLNAAVAGQGDAEPDGGGLAGDGHRDLMPGPVAAARGGRAAAVVEQGPGGQPIPTAARSRPGAARPGQPGRRCAAVRGR